WVERRGAQGVCRREYTARELGVRAGAVVTVLETESGWCWCADSLGHSGWVPASQLGEAV
ncbi:MAG: SH3 domain-containing protein, partial [Anaerolineales bacterium]|nr:SH3 domain-containing protein [Anaerolineales bacterium]